MNIEHSAVMRRFSAQGDGLLKKNFFVKLNFIFSRWTFKLGYFNAFGLANSLGITDF